MKSVELVLRDLEELEKKEPKTEEEYRRLDSLIFEYQSLKGEEK